MDLLFLDENFKVCKIVDSFKSFAWNRRYFDCREFFDRGFGGCV